MKLNGGGVLIGVESEPVKTVNGIWHRLSINKLTAGYSVVGGDLFSLVSGSLSDCSGSVTVSYRSEKVVAEMYVRNVKMHWRIVISAKGNEFDEI